MDHPDPISNGTPNVVQTLRQIASESLYTLAVSPFPANLGRRWRARQEPPRWAESDFDGSFLFCRGSTRAGGGSEAAAAGIPTIRAPTTTSRFASPSSTRVPVRFDANRQPTHVVVSLEDPLLYRCPIIFMSDVGTIEFSPEEIQSACAYFSEGRVSVGGRLLGHGRVEQLGRSDRGACCLLASSRSSTSRRRIQSCTRCTT